jgi:hypothetical protein
MLQNKLVLIIYCFDSSLVFTFWFLVGGLYSNLVMIVEYLEHFLLIYLGMVLQIPIQTFFF